MTSGPRTPKTIYSKSVHQAQAAIEYLLILAVATIIALVGFKVFLPKVNQSSEVYYNKAAQEILDAPPLPANSELFRKYP